MKNRFVAKAMLFMLLAIVVVSCKRQSRSEVEEIALTGQIQTFEAPFMRFPYRVDRNDDYLVLLDLASDSMFYHIVRYPDLEYLQSIGKKGNGPDEIILPTPCQLNGDTIVLMDGAKSELFYYKDSVSGPFFQTGIRKLDLPRTLDFVVANNSVIYAEDFNGESRIIQVTDSSKERKFAIPDDADDRNNADRAYLWRSFMAYDRDTKKLALATQFGDVLEIYDMANESTKVIVGDGGRPRAEGQIEGFVDVEWSNGKIYGLYSGRSREELDRSYARGQKEPDGGNIIKVFDAEGRLMKQYRLDCFINGFTIDRTRALLIGITSNQDNPLVFFSFEC